MWNLLCLLVAGIFARSGKSNADIEETMKNIGVKRAPLIWTLCIWLLTGGLLIGCNHAADRYHPQFNAYRRQISSVLLLSPEIGVFEEMTDGRRMWRMEKSRQAQTVAFKAVAEALTARHYTVQSPGVPSTDHPEIQSVKALFRSVNRAIQLHTYGPQLYPAKIKDFEYEMGSVETILAPYHADALVLVVGHQIISTENPRTCLSIAVVEPGGQIIWYGMQGAREKLDLQAHTNAIALIRETLAPFWGAGT